MEEERKSPLYLDRFRLSTKRDFKEIVLRNEQSDPKYGFVPALRPIDIYLKYGFVPLDKPQGPTSHEVVAWVRRILAVERAGHSGTLDPMVSGVLPIGLESATKAISALLLGPKEYIAIARIHDSVPQNILESTLGQFKGPIYQKPPQRSSVRRMTRTREIYEMDFVEKEGNLLLLRVLCEAGTYVRKLIYDLGEILQVGATMVELRRTKVCDLGESDLVRLHDLFEANAQLKESKDESKLRSVVKPIESSLPFLRRIKIRDSAIDSVCHGAQLAVPGLIAFSAGVEKGELVCLVSGKGELVALAESQMNDSELQRIEHGIVAIT
ncbi:MAG: RNA-guided pseudouridylation complex pseudouridine synthase subunit Cbf5, partial [Nitrososphaerales archaeon]